MRKTFRLIFLLPFLLLAASCIREQLPTHFSLADGAPVTLKLDFGSTLPMDVQVGTKAEASRADESHVHDLYVLIFDNDDENGKKFYGRYFSYEQQVTTLRKLEDANNECWFVSNKTISGVTPAVNETKGAVKISTQAHANCTLVVLANMFGSRSIDTDDPGMVWGTLGNNDTPTYSQDYNITLSPIDAKVTFRVKVDSRFIDAIRTRYWNVNQAPAA